MEKIIRKKRILVVEDDKAIRELLVFILEGERYLITVAENGQVALNQLYSISEMPDLILLDLMMPFKDGFQFCIEKENNEKLAQIPFIVLSFDGQINVQQMRSRVVGHVRKPFDVDDMLKTVSRHCA